MKNVWIVFDLGFGDAGKGATVDFLVRDSGAKLVVRHHGGAQAGHNVVTPEGVHHTFSQFGSGTFVDGVQTLLGPAFVLHPGALAVEARRLQEKGIADPLSRTRVDQRALVVSPFQQAAARLRELARGDQPHGTCGVGVGEAVADSLAGRSDVVRTKDLANVDSLSARLEAQRRRKRDEFSRSVARTHPAAEAEFDLLDDPDSVDRTLSLWRPLAAQLRVVGPDESRQLIRDSPAVVFEGAQGVLLDQDRGFHPHTTWSNCTPATAFDLLRDTDARVHRLGVLRTYMVRHGPGPFPTHDPAFDVRFPEPHNDVGGWQGPFRRGPLDLVLLRYALSVSGGADGLAVTCLDRTGDAIPFCRAYDLGSETVARLAPPAPGDHEALRRIGSQLQRVRPHIEAVAREDFQELLAEELEVRVLLVADGPSANDRRWQPQCPGSNERPKCSKDLPERYPPERGADFPSGSMQ